MKFQWLYKDFEKILPPKGYEMLHGKTITITGATGLIGGMLVRALEHVSRVYGFDIKLIAFVRNIERARALFSDLSEDILTLLPFEIEGTFPINEITDYVIHTASPTDSEFLFTKPVETVKAIVMGTDNILDYAYRVGAKSVVYLSSMEVYGLIQKNTKLSVRDLGYIDFLKPRSSYSEGKRMAENLCIDYHLEYDVPVKIARLAQVVGPGISENSPKFFSQFLKLAVTEQNIIMHTEGASKRQFIDVTDAISAIMHILLFGENGTAYNVGNEENFYTVKDIAEIIKNEWGTSNTKVIIEKEKDVGQYPPENILNLDTADLRALSWKPMYCMKDSLNRILKGWGE